MLYYNSYLVSSNQSVYGHLQARIGSISTIGDGTTTLTLSEPVQYNMTTMQYNFASTTLDETTVVVSYSNEGGDLVCQVVEVMMQSVTNNDVPSISKFNLYFLIIFINWFY